MEFNTKQELADFIRGRVRQLLKKTDTEEYQGDPNSPMNLMLARFPELRQTLEKLLSMQYRLFVNDIEWVAPKPTTFKVILPNQQTFTLIWNTEDFLVKISGMKYDMLILQERERAVKALSELIQYSPINANLSAEDLSQQKLTPASGEPANTTSTPISDEELQ
jgi:hypothetical protein